MAQSRLRVTPGAGDSGGGMSGGAAEPMRPHVADAPLVSKGHTMGKYRLWLNHQEIGRRLRDQINTLEQERARVQKMAPGHPAPLPDTDNPIITALLSYTETGHKLSTIDVIKAAMPKLEGDSDQRQPATSAATGSASATGAVADEAVVASLLARAEQMPSDPLEQMRQLSHAQEAQFASPEPSATGASTPAYNADSVQGWWQNRQQDDLD